MAEIGQTLREARMRARIDIGEVETRTKIRARYLRAIENEEWDLLPGPVYIKSFLRTYADYLGLDSRLLVDEFKRRYEGPTDHEVRPPSRATRRRERDRTARGPRGPLVPPWAIIALVLVAVVVALGVIGSQSPRPGHPNPTSSRGAAHHKQSTTTLPTTHHSVTHKPKSVELRLVPTGAVYICVEDRSGRSLIPGVTYSAGQSVPTEKRRQLFVTLGNNAINMTVNGKPYRVPASASAIGLKVTSKGVIPLAAGHSPTCAAG